jgi:hypothetical protein
MLGHYRSYKDVLKYNSQLWAVSSSCLLFKTQLSPLGFSVPLRKHVTSPLRAQQVNAVCTYVTVS